MDMHSRNQYLQKLQEEYLKVRKKGKGYLLTEAEKRTNLSRKYLIRKLSIRTRWQRRRRKKRKEYYDGEVRLALVKCWQIFDYPCGQRLEPLLKTEVERLRKLKELYCSDEVAGKLKKISFRTIDEKLKHQRQVEYLKRKYHHKIHPLLYQKIPVKVSCEQDRESLGNIQIDLVEHCGQSTRGEYISTISSTDISTGWWEGEAILGKAQQRTCTGLAKARLRFPFCFKEIHSDNDGSFINWHLFSYTQKEKLSFSRSRPNKKNDNSLVEQKNWTHVKKFVGYLRYDTFQELEILNDLYRNELRLYKNLFQPVMKLASKERIGGKVHRRYDKPKTPYQRTMESKEISDETKHQLRKIYRSLNPAQLKRGIDEKLNQLYQVYQEKTKYKNVEPYKKLKPNTVTFLITQPTQFRLPS